MIEVRKVDRDINKIAQRVVVGAGDVEITYVIGRCGRVIEEGRSCHKQVLDDQSLIISPADYRQAIKTANAILREKRKKAPVS